MLLMASLVPMRGASTTRALAASQAASCAALELHVAPGLHPPSKPVPFTTPAPDSPRSPFTVSLPLYPGLTLLPQPIGSPFPEVVQTHYLQTASAQFHTTASSHTVQAWYRQMMPACGWRPNGSWYGNAGTFPHGITYARGPVQSLSAYIGFADQADGSTDVAIAVEAVRYPAPPAAARIHGPFVRLNIALGRYDPARTIHAIVADHQVIARFVKSIDSIKAAFSVPTVCFGGLATTGPAWMTFVRADGSTVHAYETGPGACGGLAVNGFRWLLDPGKVWSLILRVTAGRG
jgi:hypothetical protein